MRAQIAFLIYCSESRRKFSIKNIFHRNWIPCRRKIRGVVVIFRKGHVQWIIMSGIVVKFKANILFKIKKLIAYPRGTSK